jgi:hypothetical protein
MSCAPKCYRCFLGKRRSAAQPTGRSAVPQVSGLVAPVWPSIYGARFSLHGWISPSLPYRGDCLFSCRGKSELAGCSSSHRTCAKRICPPESGQSGFPKKHGGRGSILSRRVFGFARNRTRELLGKANNGQDAAGALGMDPCGLPVSKIGEVGKPPPDFIITHI